MVTNFTRGPAPSRVDLSAPYFEIKSELFEGRACLRFRSSPLPPERRELFEKNPKVQFELAVQGRFRRPNRGVVYLGAECTRPMQLGVLTRGICKIMLNVMQSLTRGLHYSFGNTNGEAPHIAFPLFMGADVVITTPAGETPPPLDEIALLPSNVDKKNAPAFHVLDTSLTYSISFFNGNLDLIRWRAINVPGVPDIRLAKFWDDMPLRLVAYEYWDGDEASSRQVKASQPHLPSVKNMLISVEVKHDNPKTV